MQKPCGDEVLSYECPLYDLLIASNFDSDSGLARVTLLGSGGHARGRITDQHPRRADVLQIPPRIHTIKFSCLVAKRTSIRHYSYGVI